MINTQQFQQGPNINQLFNNLALLNQENKATNEDKEDNEE